MLDEYLFADGPASTAYPRDFQAALEAGLTDFAPWHIRSARELEPRRQGLLNRYPGLAVLPFATRQDRDDIACWNTADSQMSVLVLHDFADADRAVRAEYDSFRLWLHAAIDDLLDF